MQANVSLVVVWISVKLRGMDAAARIRSWAPKPPARGSFRSETWMVWNDDGTDRELPLLKNSGTQ